MAVISLYLDSRKKNKTGLYPVKVAVRNGNTSYFIPTNVKVSPDNWNGGVVVGTKNDRQLNKLLENKVGLLRLKLVSVSSTVNVGKLTARELAALIDDGVELPESKETAKGLVRPFFEGFISGKKKTSTREVYSLTLRTLERFCESRPPVLGSLRFKDISYKWLCELDGWMLERGNAVNTRSIHMRNVRAVYNEAVKTGSADFGDYPFRMFRIKSEDTVKRSLSVEELRSLRDYPCEEHLRKWVDVFFISFYLCGINMADLLELPPMERGERLVYRRSKTGVLCEMDVPPEAWELIDRYRGKERLLLFGERYADRKSFIHRMNGGLQSVGEVSLAPVVASNGAAHKKKERKPLFPALTSYWARHTWATVAADLDIPDAVIDAALGHKSPYRMTDIYVRRNAKKVDAAVRRVIDYVNGTDNPE